MVLDDPWSPRLVGAGLPRQGVELAGHTDPVFKAVWSADGQHVVTIARWAHTESGGGPSAIGDRTARVWNGRDGAAGAVLRGHTREILDAAISPDGRTVATGGVDRTVRIFDLELGRPLAVLLGHQGTVRAVSFEPDGDRVVSTSEDGTTRAWDAGTGRASPPPPRGEALALSPDGERLAVLREDAGVEIVVTTTGASAGLLPDSRDVTAAAWIDDGRRLVAGGSDRRVRAFDVDTRTPLITVRLADAKADDEDEGWVRRSRSAPTGARPSAREATSARRAGPASRACSISPPGRRFTCSGRRMRDGARSTAVAISADGSRIATAGEDGEAHIWDGATGREVR